MLRKSLLVAIATAVLAVTPANAITYGFPDGDAHPNVGAMAQNTRGDGLRQVCSGTLISSTVYLTAAHCTDFLRSLGFTTAFVTFDTNFDPRRSKFYEGTMHQDPAYPGSSNDSHDIAVIVFRRPIKGITPAALPTEGLFDQMNKDGTLNQSSRFTAVGYGLSERQTGGGNPTYKDFPYRQYSISSFNSLNETWLRLSQNPATDDGGTCFGDSGGPNFIGDSNVIGGITITGDAVCRSTNVTYRTDTRSARNFLSQFVPLP
ncbi:MAG: trypsin-like serine protease [Actinomycetota bacterium]|nr:trypsin-like serine protease [Actinomycetota bacterium]